MKSTLKRFRSRELKDQVLATFSVWNTDIHFKPCIWAFDTKEARIGDVDKHTPFDHIIFTLFQSNYLNTSKSIAS